MGLNIDFTIVLFFALGLVLLYALGWLLLVPFKKLMRFVYNALVGGAVLVLCTILGPSIGLNIVINPITALITGFLGVPGAILAIILAQVFG